MGSINRGWVIGYLTGFNAYGRGSGNVSLGTDAEGLFAWITNYCQQYPLKTLENAAEALIIELTERRVP
jgi:hypothetical protein